MKTTKYKPIYTTIQLQEKCRHVWYLECPVCGYTTKSGIWNPLYCPNCSEENKILEAH